MRRFNGICIITRDVRRLHDFYRDVLQVESEGDDVFMVFSTEGAELSLFNEQGMGQIAPGSMKAAGHGGYTLEFEVEDVDREYERLTRMNIPIVKPPTTQPWGRRSIWFRDPDSNILNFYASVSADDTVAPHPGMVGTGSESQMGQDNSPGPEATKAAVREYFERLLNRKDLSVCDEMLSGDYVDHDAPLNTAPGPNSTKEFVTVFLEKYPDIRVDIKDIIAEEKKVVARIVWQGNHRESGKEFHQMGIVIFQLDDRGQLVERWSAYKILR